METIDEFPTDARLRMVSDGGGAAAADANAAATTGRLCAIHEFSDSERIVYFGNVATAHATLLSIRDKARDANSSMRLLCFCTRFSYCRFSLFYSHFYSQLRDKIFILHIMLLQIFRLIHEICTNDYCKSIKQ